MSKKVIGIFEVENALSEFNICNTLESLGAKHVNILKCTDHLKDDKEFYKLLKQKKAIERNIWDYQCRHQPKK